MAAGLTGGHPGSMISVNHVSKIVGGSTVLEDVTLQVARRECVRVAGARRSGRTTLLHLLAALVSPTSGAISIDDVDVTRHPLKARRRVAYVCDDTLAASGLRVDEYLWLVARARGVTPGTHLDDLMKGARLEPHAGVGSLTASGRAAVALAAGLAAEASVLLLDNALRAVNAPERLVFAEWIREARDRGAAVVVVSDEPDEVTTLCGRVVTLENGRLHSGLSPLPFPEEASCSR
jgi:ABC-type multidrug transport system ATPase subunit